MSTHPLSHAETWNSASDGYTAEAVQWLAPYAADALRLADVKPGEAVLDVACGPGTLALQAAAMGAQVIATDFAEAMITHLHERAREQGREIRAQVADGMALPFEDTRFAAAFSMFGLMFFPDRDRGFRELHRVLGPGGRAVVSSWQRAAETSSLARFYQAFFADLPSAGIPEEGPPLSDPAVIEWEMAAAGFQAIRVEPATHAMEAETTRGLFQSVLRGNVPVRLLVSSFDVERRRDYETRVLARLHETFGEGPIRVEMPAWLALGTK